MVMVLWKHALSWLLLLQGSCADYIDIWDIESIKFNCNNSNTFTIRSKKLFKIAVMIKNNLWKTTFLPKELKDIYDLIISNNKTELNSNDYNKLISILKEFAEFWWNVEFNYKK